MAIEEQLDPVDDGTNDSDTLRRLLLHDDGTPKDFTTTDLMDIRLSELAPIVRFAAFAFAQLESEE